MKPSRQRPPKLSASWKSGTQGSLEGGSERSTDQSGEPAVSRVGAAPDKLSTSELQAECQATRGDLDDLQGIIKAPGRHSMARLNALTLKWAYGHGKPLQRSETTGPASIGTVNIQVIQQAMNLPPERLEAWLATGLLPPEEAKVTDTTPTPKTLNP